MKGYAIRIPQTAATSAKFVDAVRLTNFVGINPSLNWINIIYPDKNAAEKAVNALKRFRAELFKPCEYNASALTENAQNAYKRETEDEIKRLYFEIFGDSVERELTDENARLKSEITVLKQKLAAATQDAEHFESLSKSWRRKYSTLTVKTDAEREKLSKTIIGLEHHIEELEQELDQWR